MRPGPYVRGPFLHLACDAGKQKINCRIIPQSDKRSILLRVKLEYKGVIAIVRDSGEVQTHFPAALLATEIGGAMAG